MCGRFTVKATWAELMALYRLTMDAPPHNLRPRYNVCPTDPVDVVTAEEGKRELVPMRWGLIPRWWSKTIKDAKIARSTPGPDAWVMCWQAGSADSFLITPSRFCARLGAISLRPTRR
jgi:putative SOS response-associated peptidase YedK